MTARHPAHRRPSSRPALPSLRPAPRTLSADLRRLRALLLPTSRRAHAARATTARVAVLAFVAVGGTWTYDHAPALYVVFLLVAIGSVAFLIADQIRRDRAALDKENES